MKIIFTSALYKLTVNYLQYLWKEHCKSKGLDYIDNKFMIIMYSKLKACPYKTCKYTMCILQWGLCNLKLYEIIILALNDGKYSWAERCALPLPPGAERASGCSLYWCFICRSFSQTRSKSMCSSCYFAVWDLSHMVSVTARARVPFRSDVWRRLMNFCSQSNTDCKHRQRVRGGEKRQSNAV